MSNIAPARTALVARILEGEGKASLVQRHSAFDKAQIATPLDKLIDKVANHAYRATDEDMAAVKACGLSEDQIFDLVVCAAVGQASRQYEQALQALNAATERSEHAPRDSR